MKTLENDWACVETESASENTKIALTWTPEERRRRGKLLETLRKTVEKEGGEFEFKG